MFIGGRARRGASNTWSLVEQLEVRATPVLMTDLLLYELHLTVIIARTALREDDVDVQDSAS